LRPVPSVRSYREYKKEWRAKMEVKLAKMEKAIRNRADQDVLKAT